ncbi:MAG: hypothetical protein IJC74_08210 [Clostridia bacterium]|nr:hypothetical protein [Clostridia bacterium]
MKKKFLSILIVFTIICSFAAIDVNAFSNIGFFPINYEYWFTTDDYGNPVFEVLSLNNTDKAIQAYEFTFIPRDAFGRDLANAMTISYYYSELDYKLDHETVIWDAYNYYYASTGTTTCRLERVLFADGSVWQNKGNCYEEANIYISGKQLSDGTYLVDKNDRKLTLLCTGYSAWAYEWYIWDDYYGWKWFDNDVATSCSVWSDSATVKLVINRNPNLYKIVSFSVAEYPEFTMSIPNSYSSDYRSYGSYNSYYNNNDVIITKSGGLPYTINLWDDNNDAYARAWYIWDDAQGWVWFSDAKGPSCNLWSAGSKAIKLVHNNNPELYTIFSFTIKPEKLSYPSGSYQQGTYI